MNGMRDMERAVKEDENAAMQCNEASYAQHTWDMASATWSAGPQNSPSLLPTSQHTVNLHPLYPDGASLLILDLSALFMDMNHK